MFRVFNQYVSVKMLLLMMLETAVIVLSFVGAAKLRFWNNPTEFEAYTIFPEFAVQTTIVVLVCLACFYFNDLYDLNAAHGAVERVLRIEQSLGAACLLLGLLYFLVPSLLLSRGVFLIGMVLATALMILTRKGLDSAWQLTGPAQRVVILGTGVVAVDLAREMARRGDLGIKLEGFVRGISSEDPGEALYGYPVLGSAAEMEEIAHRYAISRIIVALEDRRGVLPTRELVKVRVEGVRVEDAPTALSSLTGRISLRAVTPSWFVFSDGFRRSKWNDILKRILDLVGGLTGAILFSPLMLLVAVVVRLDSKGPVIYRQVRVGHKGKCFEVLKFRSMRTDAEEGTGAQWATQDDPRVTRVGRFLRKYRLDELPQFLNVIRGEMSFVGPRPERPCFVEELRKQIPYYDERHSVRPGLTGWAQVQYSYGASVEDAFKKLEYDLFYLKNMSLAFDLGIIFQTIRIVVSGHGGR